MDAFVTLDAGTGGGKCVVFDTHGNVLGVHREPWGYDLQIDPEIPFVKAFSFSPAAFWDALCRCLRAALAQAVVAPGDVVGVASTSQREGCVFLDAHGHEIYAGPNIDARGFREGLDVLNQLGNNRLYQITGHSAPFIFPLARYLWFRKHGSSPVAHLLMINDWMTYRLSGELSAEPSNAGESMLFDLRQRRWSDEILSTFDVPPDILPPLREPGDRVGRVSAQVAAATGLTAGTPVFVGGADTQCSLLGAGACDVAATAATLGTTTPVQTVVAPPVFDPQANLWAGCHVLPQRWVLESNAGDTGDAYIWLLDLVSGGLPREQLYRLGDQLATDRFGPPTMLFVGPTIFDLARMNFDRPGGILFPFPAMHVRPDRSSLVRAFMESIGYALRGNLDQLEEVTGSGASELTLSGGMTRSTVLLQILADIVGVPFRVACEPESAALGCAILVAADGDASRIPSIARAMVRHRRVDPDPTLHARYAPAYAKWRELNAVLDGVAL